MPVLFYTRFTALLALVALAVGVACLVRPKLLGDVGNRSLVGLASLVAIAATAGSLIYSEYYLFEPCRLCWYQRIAMYPLGVVLVVGWWKRDRDVARYAIPLAVIGAGISIWHLANQWLLSGDTCGVGPACSIRYVTEFGFVTIPFMALSGFIAIVGLLHAGRRT